MPGGNEARMALQPAERHALIDQYAAGPRRLREAFEQVPQAALQWRPAPGKWSVHEVVVHCADSEMNAALRIRYILAESPATIIGYDQDVWSRTLDYHAHDVQAALAAVEAARGHTVPLLRTLDNAAWARMGTHTEVGAYGAEHWLQTYAAHLETHARQIQRNLDAWRAQA
jgi:hypothetical protein